MPRLRALIIMVAAANADNLRGLPHAIVRARGVYVDPTKVTDPITANTVLMVSFNLGYMHFFRNWVCHAQRLGLKYLAWPEETGAHRAVMDSDACRDNCTLYFSPHLSTMFSITPKPSDFRWMTFNAISKFKFVSVLSALRLGAHIWFSDVDIAFIRDPWPFMLEVQGDGRCDYVFQTNNRQLGSLYRRGSAGNTGFHFFRASPLVKDFLNQSISFMYRNKELDDQTLFWDHLNRADYDLINETSSRWQSVNCGQSQSTNCKKLQICPLDSSLFTIGKANESFLREHASIIYHANYLVGSGEKRDALSQRGLWLLQASACQSFPTDRYP